MNKILFNSKISWLYAFLFALFLHVTFLYAFLFSSPMNDELKSGSFASKNRSDKIKSITIVQNVSVGKLQETRVDSKKQVAKKPTIVKKVKKKKKQVKIKTYKAKLHVKIKKSTKTLVKKEVKQEKVKQKEFKEIKSSVNSINSKQTSASAPLPLNNNTISSTNTGHSNSKNTSWKAKVMYHLSKYRKYPLEALKNNIEGISKVRVSIDKEGNVVNLKLKKSSKYSILDKDSLSLFRKASPLPKPPEFYFKSKTTISFTIPIEYNIKQYLKEKNKF